jgi:FkbM family methyltransferase
MIAGIIAAALVTAAQPCQCDVGSCARLSLPETRPVLCVRRAAEDVHVVGSIRRSGIWELPIVQSVLAEIRRRPGYVVLDIGAHLGQYSVVAAAAGAQVVAFEASADNCRHLVASLKVNKLTHQVTVVNQPVTEQANQRLQYPAGLPSDNTGGWGVELTSGGPLVSTTIDDTVRDSFAGHQFLMKIDIEGYEPQALQGAKSTLLRTAVIWMEWGGGGQSKASMGNWLASLGFEVDSVDCAQSMYTKCPWDVVWRRG